MNTGKWFIPVLLTFHVCIAVAQKTKTYVVHFKDKDTAAVFDPYTYFHPKAVSRRIAAGLPLYDYSDLPVNEAYVEQVREAGGDVHVISRWLNAVFIHAGEKEAEQVKKLPFVSSIKVFDGAPRLVNDTVITSASALSDKDFLALSHYQTQRFSSQAFLDRKLTGRGIRIAVFDVGFNGAEKHEAFRHLRENGQIRATYDFIDRGTNVYHGGAHGTNTLSCIAGRFNGVNLGMAPDAEFLLARTEWTSKERIAEEYCWLAAAEWADKNGAQIISSSLGYGGAWYRKNELNGRHSIVAFAATMAAGKGILVINSAGNEYQRTWKMIITPSDADSVLCVGGTDPYTDRHISFSSIGPSADFRLKPNISAPGHVVVARPAGGRQLAYGTSFSCPLVAGFAACAWQSDTTLTNMQLFRAIEQSAHLYPYFDYMHGFGIPRADLFLERNRDPLPPTFTVSLPDSMRETITVSFPDSLIRQRIAGFYEQSENVRKGLNLYWHIESARGRLRKYEVISVTKTGDLSLSCNEAREGDTIRIHFEGYTYHLTWQKH